MVPYSTSSYYDIQEKGPVQQISYASETERGTLRIKSPPGMDRERLVKIVVGCAGVAYGDVNCSNLAGVSVSRLLASLVNICCHNNLVS